LVEAPSLGLIGYAIAKALEFGRIEVAHPLILLRRHDHGYIAVLAADYDRLTLGGVKQGSKALFGLGSRYGSHMYIVDKIDKLVNLSRSGL
jgi:hypothetical protein